MITFWSFVRLSSIYIWAEPQHFLHVCPAKTQTSLHFRDQSIPCRPINALDPWLQTECPAKTLYRLRSEYSMSACKCFISLTTNRVPWRRCTDCDLSIPCRPANALDPWLQTECPAKTLYRLRSEYSISACKHFRSLTTNRVPWRRCTDCDLSIPCLPANALDPWLQTDCPEDAVQTAIWVFHVCLQML